jgi:hypothetical protein
MKKTFLSLASILVLTALIFTSQTSCKKETTTTTVIKTDTLYKCTPSVLGLWSGVQENALGSGTFNVSVKADGTMTYENIILGTQQLCTGTWTLSNGVFTFNTVCVYGASGNIGVRQRFTATFNSSTGTLTAGQWQNTFPISNTNSGTFILNKVN